MNKNIMLTPGPSSGGNGASSKPALKGRPSTRTTAPPTAGFGKMTSAERLSYFRNRLNRS